MIEQGNNSRGTAEIDEKAFIGRKQKKVKKKRKNMPIFGNEYLKSMLQFSNWVSRRCRNDSVFDERNRTSERMYPQETYAQGPILAIQELAVRFLS